MLLSVIIMYVMIRRGNYLTYVISNKRNSYGFRVVTVSVRSDLSPTDAFVDFTSFADNKAEITRFMESAE